MDPIYWHTFLARPYVFLFFAVWGALSLRHLGLKPSLIWLTLGYAIAWASEASSIRTGFPYGWYFYRYENLQNEWLLFGVPVWDSLSYVFLSYAGFCVALFIVQKRRILVLALLTALATTLLDIIIDPLAHQGSKWFLGDIYYYPRPGVYFDVPLSNFAGWFLTTGSIALGFLLAMRRRPLPRLLNQNALLLGLAFYFGIAVFMVGITLWIGNYPLAAADITLITLLISGIIWRLRRGDRDESV